MLNKPCGTNKILVARVEVVLQQGQEWETRLLLSIISIVEVCSQAWIFFSLTLLISEILKVLNEKAM